MKYITIISIVLISSCCNHKCELERCIITGKYEENHSKRLHQYWKCSNGGEMEADKYYAWEYSQIGDTVEIDSNCNQHRVK